MDHKHVAEENKIVAPAGSHSLSRDEGKFEFHAKQLFLTYANVLDPDVSKEDLLDFLRDRLPDADLIYIGRELHESGVPHYHVYLHFSRKLHTRDCHLLDMPSSTGDLHPNWSSVRSSAAVRKYCLKAGDYLVWPPDDVPGTAPTSSKQCAKRAIELAEEGKIDAAIKHVRENDSGRWLVHALQMEQNLRRVTPSINYPDFDYPADFVNVPDEIRQWHEADYSFISLVLWGDSGYGKTALAKSLLGAGYVFVRHMDALKRYDLSSPFISGLIFDDMSFRHWPCDQVKHLVDLSDESHINVKHGMVVLPKRLPRIFTTNRADLFAAADAGEADAAAIARRVKYVHIGLSLIPGEEFPDAQDPWEF